MNTSPNTHQWRIDDEFLSDVLQRIVEVHYRKDGMPYLRQNEVTLELVGPLKECVLELMTTCLLPKYDALINVELLEYPYVPDVGCVATYLLTVDARNSRWDKPESGMDEHEHMDLERQRAAGYEDDTRHS